LEARLRWNLYYHYIPNILVSKNNFTNITYSFLTNSLHMTIYVFLTGNIFLPEFIKFLKAENHYGLQLLRILQQVIHTIKLSTIILNFQKLILLVILQDIFLNTQSHGSLLHSITK